MVHPFPSDYPRLSPYLTVGDGNAALDFYTKVLGGTERLRLPTPSGGVAHAEVAFGEALIMLSEKDPMVGNKSPEDLGGSPVTMTLYVEDTDAVVADAIKHGATLLDDVTDTFYGARSGSIKDPFGHIWAIMTQTEELSAADLLERYASFDQDSTS